MNRKNKPKILIVDDHPIVRHGLGRLINQENDLLVCAEAENAAKALEVLENRPVDLAVVDISMKGKTGIQLTEKIKQQFPNLPVLILSMHDELTYARRALRAGAKGYVVKHEAAEEIVTAIRNVLSGKVYISKTMAERLTIYN